MKNQSGIKLSLILLLLSFVATGQNKQYNTRIDTAGKVTINSGTTIILKADSVFIGQIIIDQAVPTKVYFLGSITTQDSTGIYTTTFKFAPRNNTSTFDVNITINFDKPFIPWYTTERLPPNTINPLWTSYIFDVRGDNGDSQASESWSKTYHFLRVRGLVSADNIYIAVKSKEKLFATITGALENK